MMWATPRAVAVHPGFKPRELTSYFLANVMNPSALLFCSPSGFIVEMGRLSHTDLSLSVAQLVSAAFQGFLSSCFGVDCVRWTFLDRTQTPDTIRHSVRMIIFVDAHFICVYAYMYT